MADYESSAYMSLERLKERHDQELMELKERVTGDYINKYTYSKETLEKRQMERK